MPNNMNEAINSIKEMFVEAMKAYTPSGKVECECGSEKTLAKRSFKTDDGIVRIRECEKCGRSFTTTEVRLRDIK